MEDANDFLMRGGTPSVKFPTIGSTVIGMITKQPKVAEVTDAATGEVKRWPNGEVKKQLIIELQTELRESDDDGGERTLWCKGQMQVAVRDAVRNAGAKGLQVGGVIQVTYASDKKTNLNPQKIFTASYWPPQPAPVEVPSSPWDQQPAPQQNFYGQPIQQQPQYVQPQMQATVQARPVTPPPTSAPPAQHTDNQLSFLERLKQTTEAQQAHRNAQGLPQDAEPPF